MVQLYLLSIVLNGFTGFLLVFGDMIEGGSTANGFKLFLSSWGFRLVLGVLAAITGVLKFLSPIMNKMPILGDMLPALAGIAAGFILIFGFYRENSAKSDDSGGLLDRIGDTFLQYKKVVGVLLLIIAALHFLFPTALFL
ncbi:MAG: hypothetical protein LBU85_04075 [Treponema sp.]|jgi:hypothetical protein|nr:hypothetical protein [Treponema sp.]